MLEEKCFVLMDRAVIFLYPKDTGWDVAAASEKFCWSWCSKSRVIHVNAGRFQPGEFRLGSVNNPSPLRSLNYFRLGTVVLQLLQNWAGILCFQQNPQGLSRRFICWPPQTFLFLHSFPEGAQIPAGRTFPYFP